MKRILSILLAIPIFSLGQMRGLQYFINQAAINNAPLVDIRNQIRSNQIDSALLKATIKTQVNFVSNNMYAPVIKGWGYDEIITNLAQVSGMVQATRTFLSKGNLAAQYRKISLEKQSLKDTLLLSEKELVRAITDQYITAYGEQVTMDYSSDLYALLTKESDILKKLAQANVIRQTEYLAFDVTVKQQELTYLQAQLQYNADYLTLNFLAGIDDTSIVQIEKPGLEDSTQQDLFTSAFYQRYVHDSLRIANERKLVDYSYKPTINVFTDAGLNTSLQNTPYKNIGISFGVNVKVPIYDGHQKGLRYEKLNIEEQTRLANKTFFTKQYKQQVAQLNIELHATDLLFDKIKQQVDYTKTLILAYEKLLETSDAKVTDLVTAISNYLNAQHIYRQNFIDRLRIRNQINYWRY